MVPQQNTTAENGHNALQNGMNNDGTNTVQQEKVQAGSTWRQVSSMLSTKFAPTSTDEQGMSHGWKTTGGPNMWQSGAYKSTSTLGVIQKDIGGMTLKRL